VTDNVAAGEPEGFLVPSGGAGIYATGGAELTGTEVARNDAWLAGSTRGLGGGIHVAGGLLVATDCAIRENRGGLAYGGGIYAYEASVALAGTTTVSDNRGEAGAGVFVHAGSLSGGVLSGNVASDAGGGFYIQYGTGVDGVTVTANDADWGGGGVYLGDGVIGGSVVDANTARAGAGLYLQPSALVGEGSVAVEGVTLTGNVASQGGGGLEISANTGPVSIANSVVTDNQARDGAGIHAMFGPVSVTSTAILRNVAGQDGGGILLEYDAELDVEACDLGSDADDNLPDDVSIDGDGVSGYGAGATFSCDSRCEP
jgi:hypothetical protein